MTSGNFSDKSWSGTPMWQIQEELEAQREKRAAEERRKATTPVAVLNLRVEGDRHLCELTLLIPPKASQATDLKVDPAAVGFREVKVRGPRRQLRAEALKDGFELRATFHRLGEAAVWTRCRELKGTTWSKEDLLPDSTRIEEDADREQRLRLAQRPRGTGWTRKKDAEFFLHSHSPMAYDPKKRQYFTIVDGQRYVACDPPHDPVEYSISVAAGSSVVGRSEADLALPERPRTLLLKELVKTGAAMKKPLFFLDQPASCFVLFEGIRGSAAADYCSKNFHTKLLGKLSSSLQFWSDAMIQTLLDSIMEELESELLQQAATCYDGVSVAIAVVLGDRLAVATLGDARALLTQPDGSTRVLGGALSSRGGHRVGEEGPERQRINGTFAEIIEGEFGSCVRRPVLPREITMAQEQGAEIERVLDRAPDSFAALGFSEADVVDAKAAKAQYRKLALKVHPDKVAASDEALKARAKEAFSKIEAAVERIETLCETDSAATKALHKLLVQAGSVEHPVMPRSWALGVLGLEEGATLEEAEKAATKLREPLEKLGQFEGGRLAHPDAARAGRILEEALEVLAAPKKGDGNVALKLDPVPVIRALGLRDLKRPRPILSAKLQIDYVPLDRVGRHYIALLSSTATTSLSDKEVANRIRRFPRQPKAASFVLAEDASSVAATSSTSSPSAGAGSSAMPARSRHLASSVVGVLDVTSEEDRTMGGRAADTPPAAPLAKKARTSAAAAVEQSGKIRCLHILLKHKDLKIGQDAGSVQRLRGKPPVSRTSFQAERQLFEMQKALAADPNIFHVLARKHSECDTAIQPGQSAGDLGWITRGATGYPQFEDAMFALGVYEVSDIVTTPRGLHIIQRVA